MKNIIKVILAISLIINCHIAVSAQPQISQIIGNGNTVVFTDVGDDHWAKDAIYYFASQGIVQGNGDGTFSPDDKVTRAEFCQMLVLTFGAKVSTPKTSSFSDVNTSSWYAPAIEASKDFMTAYQNPFGGNPAFHPNEDATREDIATALIKIMGFTASDLIDKSCATRAFSDFNSISYALKDYVSLAYEKSLISGYPDGTFGPKKGITRAETVVMLNNATKTAYTSASTSNDFELYVNKYYSRDGKTATVTVQTSKGVDVSVNGQVIEMIEIEGESPNYAYGGIYTYKFPSGGTKELEIVGKRNGVLKTQNVELVYEEKLLSSANNHRIQIKVDKYAERVETEEIVLTGTVISTRYEDGIIFTLNGDDIIKVNHKGEWSKKVTLEPGKNTLNFVAKGEYGEEDKETLSIFFGPELEVSEIPSTTTSQTLPITVKVMTDSRNGVLLEINGKSIELNDKHFHNLTNPTYVYKTNLSLTEGKNAITIKALPIKDDNCDGGEAIKTFNINCTYETPAPTLTFTECPTDIVTELDDIYLGGTVYDENDPNPTVTVNGRRVSISDDGYWRHSVSLKEGENTFTVKATNKFGKETEITKTVTFNPNIEPPEISIDEPKKNVNTPHFTLTGCVLDENDPNPKVTVNGIQASVDKNFWEVSLDLTNEETECEIVAENKWGKLTTASANVTFHSVPELEIDNLNDETTEDSIIISGYLFDELDENPIIRINGKEITHRKGAWSTKVQLDKEMNIITVIVENKYGNTVKEQRTVYYFPVESESEEIIEESEEDVEPEENTAESEEVLNEENVYNSNKEAILETDLFEEITNELTPVKQLLINGKKYMLFEICTTKESAEKYCNSIGGKLAEINSDEEKSTFSIFFGNVDCWIASSIEDINETAETKTYFLCETEYNQY